MNHRGMQIRNKTSELKWIFKRKIWSNDKKLLELKEIWYEIALKFVGEFISELKFNDNLNIKKFIFHEV